MSCFPLRFPTARSFYLDLPWGAEWTGSSVVRETIFTVLIMWTTNSWKRSVIEPTKYLTRRGIGLVVQPGGVIGTNVLIPKFRLLHGTIFYSS
jgi:hypothetical protein